jgi:hypothetical protein
MVMGETPYQKPKLSGSCCGSRPSISGRDPGGYRFRRVTRKVPVLRTRVCGTRPIGAGLAYSEWEIIMARCETCGNDYDKAFKVTMNGTTHTFDSFECAIHALAPTCANCGIHIVGHGLEKEATFFCCEHCAEAKGVSGLRDRIGVGGVIEMGSRQ